MEISIGTVVGRWTIIARAEPRVMPSKTVAQWLCRCECGVERAVLVNSLRREISKSCGCLAKEVWSRVHTKHGATVGDRCPEYDVWGAMKERCYNPNNKRYADYGGRGITVCDRWRNDFAAFLADMGHRPSDRHSLDRENNGKNYEPGNCKWSLPHEQMTNRRNTRFVEVDGVSVPLATLSKQCGVPANTLRARVLAGWDIKAAMATPVAKRRPFRRLIPG